MQASPYIFSPYIFCISFPHPPHLVPFPPSAIPSLLPPPALVSPSLLRLPLSLPLLNFQFQKNISVHAMMAGWEQLRWLSCLSQILSIYLFLASELSKCRLRGTTEVVDCANKLSTSDDNGRDQITWFSFVCSHRGTTEVVECEKSICLIGGRIERMRTSNADMLDDNGQHQITSSSHSWFSIFCSHYFNTVKHGCSIFTLAENRRSR